MTRLEKIRVAMKEKELCALLVVRINESVVSCLIFLLLGAHCGVLILKDLNF